MELFSFLEPLRDLGFRVGMTPRIPEVGGSLDREATLAELEPYHREAVEELGFAWGELWRAEQVHGAEVARVPGEERVVAGVDGLVTDCAGVALGIYVADCGLIWLADARRGAVGLVHSGRKGTEGNVLGAAVGKMEEEFGSRPEDLVVVLGPCIRPPRYEVDFAAEIGRQAERAGVGRFEDCGLCTGSDLGAFYSYREEKGATGRMLGIIGIG